MQSAKVSGSTVIRCHGEIAKLRGKGVGRPCQPHKLDIVSSNLTRASNILILVECSSLTRVIEGNKTLSLTRMPTTVRVYFLPPTRNILLCLIRRTRQRHQLHINTRYWEDIITAQRWHEV